MDSEKLDGLLRQLCAYGVSSYRDGSVSIEFLAPQGGGVHFEDEDTAPWAGGSAKVATATEGTFLANPDAATPDNTDVITLSRMLKGHMERG